MGRTAVCALKGLVLAVAGVVSPTADLRPPPAHPESDRNADEQ
jgi:hypothetical protein